MAITLENKNLQIFIDFPKENYTGSRFDWSTKIIQINYRGIPLLASELDQQTLEQDKSFGRGLYNEFGSSLPLGFDSAQIGDRFHKIAIGTLEKKAPIYSNQKQIEVNPVEFKFDHNPKQFNCLVTAQTINGYSYSLQKSIQMQENSFSIHYTLTNTGSKVIKTNEYNHNFLCFKGSPINSYYKLTIPSDLRLLELTELVNKEKVISIKDNVIQFTKKPSEAIFISTELKDRYVDAFWKLENNALNIGMSETGDFKNRQFHLWGCAHVISPELFIDIEINPSETKEWTRTYSFYELT